MVHPWFGYCPLFYGEGIWVRHLSYAVSFGNHAAAGLDPAWAAKLRNFDLISVRDANFRIIVGKALGTGPRWCSTHACNFRWCPACGLTSGWRSPMWQRVLCPA